MLYDLFFIHILGDMLRHMNIVRLKDLRLHFKINPNRGNIQELVRCRTQLNNTHKSMEINKCYKLQKLYLCEIFKCTLGRIYYRVS